MSKLLLFTVICVCALVGVFVILNNVTWVDTDSGSLFTAVSGEKTIDALLPPVAPHPLSITALKSVEYIGSDLVIEETLSPGTNYQRYRVSYLSEGLKQYALLTIPNGERPQTGWPVIIFNHGYIAPSEYRTTERYIAYTDGFSRNGYMLIRPDYRGHDQSEGEAVGGYGSNAYTVDVLNALASVKRHPDADAQRIGMWGHSMGGHITMRAMVVDPSIKAGVIWAGVVGSYPDLLRNWRRGNAPPPTPMLGSQRGRWRAQLIEEYGEPEENPDFWNSLSANSFIDEISGPVQLHHGTADTSVPVEFSETLAEQMETQGKIVDLHVYPGDDHNLTENFSAAMRRSIEFFDSQVKGE